MASVSFSHCDGIHFFSNMHRRIVHPPGRIYFVAMGGKHEHESRKKDLVGKTIAVVGLGVSGKAAAELAIARGASVIAIDRNENLVDPSFRKHENLQTVLGPCTADFLKDADRVVVSPGVPLTNYGLQDLLQSGKEVMSELDFAAEILNKDAAILAVTGTNGKSTVTSYASQLLQHSGIKSFTGGNIGIPLSKAALRSMESTGSEFQVLVVEVSSYQLEIPNKYFRPSVAVVLNLTPDHLERHKTMQNYAFTKCQLFRHMTDDCLAVLPAGNKLLSKAFRQQGKRYPLSWIGDLPGVKMDMDMRVADIAIPTTGLVAELDLNSLNAVGAHNFLNAAVASFCVLGLRMGIDIDTINDGIWNLYNLPHRMQIIHVDNEEITWINDSKATNVEATYAGLMGLKGFKSIILLGGIEKQCPEYNGSSGFEHLAGPLKHHRAVITFGASGEKIRKTLRNAGLAIPCAATKSLGDAVTLARTIAKSGDAIVLSPGCASFDEFENFEHRGKVFSELALLSS